MAKISEKQYKSFLLALFKNKQLFCYLCNKLILLQKDISIDHVYPKSKGGASNVSNYLPAHKDCNQAKKALTLQQYIKSTDNVK